MSEEEEIVVQPPRKLSLVHDIANWHRWWSMRWLIAGAIAEALPGAWSALPADWVGPMPTWLKLALGYFVGAALVGAAVSRVIQQSPKARP